jgi:hypothetical protein
VVAGRRCSAEHHVIVTRKPSLCCARNLSSSSSRSPVDRPGSRPGDSQWPLLYSGSNRPDASAPFRFPPFVAPHYFHLLSRNVLRSRGDRHYEELHGAHKRCERGQQHRDEDRTGCFVRRSSPSRCTRSCMLTRCISGAMKAIHGTSLRQ